MNFLEFDPSVVCLSLSLIDSLHGLFFTTFLFHFFILLRPFGQQHANAEHFVLSSVSDLCTQATSIFYLRSDLSIHYCQLHSTFLYDLSFWRSYSALVSLHTGLRYVLYLQIIIKKKNTPSTCIWLPHTILHFHGQPSLHFLAVLLMW